MSTNRYDPRDPVRHEGLDPAVAGADIAHGAPSSSTLDDLRAAVEQSEQVAQIEFADHELFSPGRHIRLSCSTDLEQSVWKRIQLASLPQSERRKTRPNQTKLKEIVMLAGLIGELTTEIATLQKDGSYRPLEGTFKDPALLAQLGATDVSVAVARVFGGKDAYVLHAGQGLLDACGYGERKPGESGESDEDPT